MVYGVGFAALAMHNPWSVHQQQRKAPRQEPVLDAGAGAESQGFRPSVKEYGLWGYTLGLVFQGLGFRV